MGKAHCVMIVVTAAILAGCGGKQPTSSEEVGKNEKIAFVSCGIYVVDSDGTDLRQLTQGLNYDPPVWSPDGTKLLFAAGESYALFGYQIYSMELDGTEPHQLTSRDYNVQPAWSPDGTKIAFTSVAAGDDSENGSFSSDIYTMDSDGNNQNRLTSGGDCYDPSWSPDGSKIAYYEGTTLSMMNVDGSSQRQLSPFADPIGGEPPRWSPDGKMIAFSSEGRIYTTTVESGLTRQIIPSESDEDEGYGFPSWAPDRDDIAFYGKSGTIYVSRADGTGRRVLAKVEVAEDPVNAPFAWSRDGSQIAFGSRSTGAIYLVDRNGVSRPLITGSVGVCCPVWSP